MVVVDVLKFRVFADASQEVGEDVGSCRVPG